MEEIKCKCCSGPGILETGKYISENSIINFVMDTDEIYTKVKICFACDGTGIPKRLENK